MKRTAFAAAVMSAVLSVSSSHAQYPVHAWSQRFGGTSADLGAKVAADGSGNVYVTGHFAGTIDFGGGPLTSAGNTDIFVVKFDANGTYLWSRAFGGTAADDGFDIAVDSPGNVALIGAFQGAADFGGGPLTSAGARDIFLARFDAAGTHVWSKRFGAASDDFGYSVVMDAFSAVVAAGRFRGAMSFGGPIVDTHSYFNDIFLAKYDADGTHRWSRGFVDNGGNLDATAVAVDATGRVFLTGSFAGTTSFGGASLSASEYDIFLARYDAFGSHQWSKRFGSPPRDAAYDVAVDPSGNVIITGFFGFTTAGSTIDFGGGIITGAGSADIFLAEFDSDGVHRWSHGFGGTDFDQANSVCADPNGNVAITGRLRMSADFGGGPLTVAGLNDVFIAKFNASGVHQWSQRWGGTNSEIGNGVSADADGAFLLTGQFPSTINFGGGALSSAGGDDIFVARFIDPEPVPVLVTSFVASPGPNGIELRWTLWSDESPARFTIYRGTDGSPTTGIASGDMGSRSRSFLDTGVEPGRRYAYQIIIHTHSGYDFRSPVVTTTAAAAIAFLGQNRPNPFNPATAIEYTLETEAHAVISIFDAAGALVARLDQGMQSAGSHRLEWSGRDDKGQPVGSGVYFYRLEGIRSAGTRKMVLLK